MPKKPPNRTSTLDTDTIEERLALKRSESIGKPRRKPTAPPPFRSIPPSSCTSISVNSSSVGQNREVIADCAPYEGMVTV